MPIKGGAGIIVCEPAATGMDEQPLTFTAGCARWLQFTVGGQGELGKTPLWTAIARAERELGRSDLRLTPDEAVKLCRITGATHAAIGTAAGTADHITLTYQLYALATKKPVGAALKVSGTKAQIVAALPDLARGLAQSLGVSAPRVPAHPDATAADLS